MISDNVKPNSFKAWFLAARPKTLSSAAVPVVVGLAYAAREIGLGNINAMAALLSLLFALVMQIDANFVNDLFDFRRGDDNEERLGPKRACQMGWISEGKMLRGITVTTLVACLTGLPLVSVGGIRMVLVGVACVVFCFLYTTLFSRIALGDVLVVLFFGLIPVSVVCFLQTKSFTGEIIWLSLLVGLVVDNLLIVNNFRDVEQDMRAGKRTLVSLIGKSCALWLYLLIGLAACLSAVVYAFRGCVLMPVFLLPYFALHIITFRKMRRIGHGKALNAVLGATARNTLLFGLGFALGLVV